MVPMMAAAAANPELTNKAISGVGKALKIVGIAVGAGLVGFVVYKVVKKVKQKADNNKRLEAYTAFDEAKDGTMSYDNEVYVSMADSLYTAFDNRKNSLYCSYDDKSIYRTLEKLRSIADWKMLVKAFATKPANNSDGGVEHDLVWYLGANKANHKADYQAILDKIGLPGILGRLK